MKFEFPTQCFHFFFFTTDLNLQSEFKTVFNDVREDQLLHSATPYSNKLGEEFLWVRFLKAFFKRIKIDFVSWGNYWRVWECKSRDYIAILWTFRNGRHCQVWILGFFVGRVGLFTLAPRIRFSSEVQQSPVPKKSIVCPNLSVTLAFELSKCIHQSL